MGGPRVPSHGIPWVPKGSPPMGVQDPSHGIPWAPKGSPPMGPLQWNPFGLPRVLSHKVRTHGLMTSVFGASGKLIVVCCNIFGWSLDLVLSEPQLSHSTHQNMSPERFNIVLKCYCRLLFSCVLLVAMGRTNAILQRQHACMHACMHAIRHPSMHACMHATTPSAGRGDNECADPTNL